jgi:signal transduction histidine kinase
MGDVSALTGICIRAIARTGAGACVLLADADDDGRFEPLANAGEIGLVENYLGSVSVSVAHLPIPRIGARAVELWRLNPSTQRAVPLTDRGRLLGILVLLYDAPVRMHQGLFDLSDVVEAAIAIVRAERAERRSERYERLLAGIDVGIAMLDEGGEVRVASPAFSRMVGRRNVIGKQIEELLGAGIAFRPEPVDVELPGGAQTITCSLRIVPDEARGWVATLTEVGPVRALPAEVEERGAELAEANARLRQARAVERAFLSVVAHELRNPLAIAGHAYELLRSDARYDGIASSDELEAIGSAITTLERRIGDLVTFARLEVNALSIEMGTVDILDILEGACRCLCDPRVELRTPKSSDIPVLAGDAGRIRQAFENLLLNASAHARDSIVISVESTPRSVVVTVANDGEGIEAKDRERILEPFVRLTSGRPGMGLGLSIARGLVEAHGGTLRVVDHPLGIAFEVTLPFDGSPARSARED